MSIATEIQRLKQAKADIKTAIEGKGVEVDDGSIDTYASKISEISMDSGVDYLPVAKLIQFNSLNDFSQSEVVLNLQNCTTLVNLCNVQANENRNNVVKHLTLNSGSVTGMTSVLQCNYANRDLTLQRLTLNMDVSKVTIWANAFNCLAALEIIDGQPLDFTSATNFNNIFNYCNSLIEIRIVQGSIPISINFAHSANLSDTSIDSIINGLADKTGGTAQMLTLHATVGAKLTDAQKATIAAKNWTAIY